MSQHCPDCGRRIEMFAVRCAYCGWSLIEAIESSAAVDSAASIRTHYELHYQSTLKFIEQNELDAALVAVNKAIHAANSDQSGEAYALRAYTYLKRGDCANAEEDCNRAIQLGWLEPKTFAWRAAALARQDRWREALIDLQEARDLSHAQLDQLHYDDMINGYWNQAIQFYEREMQLDPSQIARRRDRHWVELLVGKLEEAAAGFELLERTGCDDALVHAGLAEVRLRQERPEDALIYVDPLTDDENLFIQRMAWELRARACSQLQDATGADEALTELTSLAQGDLRWSIKAAWLRLELGDPLRAVQEFFPIIEAARRPHELALLGRGRAYEQIGNFEQARSDYRRLLRVRPNFAAAMFAHARVSQRQGDFTTAQADLKELIALDPKNEQAWLALSRLQLLEKQLAEAFDSCHQALQIDNRNPAAYWLSGQISLALGQYAQAVEAFSQAETCSATAADRAESLYQRAAAHVEMQAWDAAQSDLQQALTLRPQHAGTHVWLAVALARSEDWAQSVLHLQRAMALHPNDARKYRIFGQSVAEQAIEHFTRLIQREHNEADVFRGRAIAWQFLGKANEAITDFTKVIKLDPRDWESRVRRGQLLQQLGSHDQAINDFTKVIRVDRQNHVARYFRAISLVISRDLEIALSDLNKAILIAPQQSRYHLLRGEVLQRRGKMSSAIRAYTRAAQLNPADAKAYRLRGSAWVALGQPKLALADLSRCLEIKPEAEVLMHRGQTLLKLGENEQSLKDFEAAIKLDRSLGRAVIGRANALLKLGRHQTALVWLTKSIHAFQSLPIFSEILVARGKAFFEMGRPTMAITDFSAAIKRVEQNPQLIANIRYLRSLAWIADQQFSAAERDCNKVLDTIPEHADAQAVLRWLRDRTQPIPIVLATERPPMRIAKPPVAAGHDKLKRPSPRSAAGDPWYSPPPFDAWLVRSVDRKEFGPVSKSIMDRWVDEGRLTVGMKLMRCDWPRWKRVEKVYAHLRDDAVVEKLPQLPPSI